MKLWLALLLLGANALFADNNQAPSTAEQERMLMEAVMFSSKGFYADAEARLKRLVEFQPDQPMFRQMLTEVQRKRTAQQAEPSVALKRKLAETILPQVKFREANLQDVLGFLQEQVGINIVYITDEPATKPITLNLRQIPAGEVIKYATQMAGLAYRVEAHAVVIFKPAPPPPSPPADAKPE